MVSRGRGGLSDPFLRDEILNAMVPGLSDRSFKYFDWGGGGVINKRMRAEKNMRPYYEVKIDKGYSGSGYGEDISTTACAALEESVSKSRLDLFLIAPRTGSAAADNGQYYSSHYNV